MIHIRTNIYLYHIIRTNIYLYHISTLPLKKVEPKPQFGSTFLKGGKGCFGTTFLKGCFGSTFLKGGKGRKN